MSKQVKFTAMTAELLLKKKWWIPPRNFREVLTAVIKKQRWSTSKHAEV